MCRIPILAILEVELVMGDIDVAERALLHARLCRVFPHLADAITYLVHTDEMPTPATLDAAGRPRLVTNIPQPAPAQPVAADMEVSGHGR